MADHLAEVLNILYHNGFQPSRDAYDALERYKSDPAFAAALGTVFTSAVFPPLSPEASARLPGAITTIPWVQFRMLAGIALKNSLSSGSAHVVAEAAKCCVAQLRDPSTTDKLACTAAQIAVKICSIVGRFEWWEETGICNFAGLILSELLTAISTPSVVLGGLFCLQFLFEDAPKLLGETSDVIIKRVSEMASVSQQTVAVDERLRKAAFKVALHAYEIGAVLEWNVEHHGPMQRGLINGCSVFAQCCTQLLNDPHSPLAILALRGAALLLDYIDYFMTDANTAHVVVTSWIRAATHHIHSAATPEHAMAAADFISTALSISESTGGEGTIVMFERAITQQLQQLIPKLFQYIVLTADDVGSIMENDYYTFRDVAKVLHRSGTSSATPSIDADDGSNEDEIMSELRKAAASCIDKICVVAHQGATPLIKMEMSTKWGHQDWIIKEAALLGFGCAVRGCLQDLAQDLPHIVSNLESIIRDEQQHVCTVSMAMWCVDRVADWLFNAGRNSVSTIMAALTGRLASQSKRVQQSATTAIQKMLKTSISAQFVLPAEIFGALVATISECLSKNLYNTKSLSNLCDLAICIVAMVPEGPLLTSFASTFFQARGHAMAAFEASYRDTVVESKPNHAINCDVMSVDRVVVASFIRIPQPEHHTQLLTTWAAVLWDIAMRRCFDDADLVFSTLFNASRLVGNLDTAHLTAWLASRNFDLVKATLQIAEHCGTHSCIRCSCLEMLECVVRVAQGAAIEDAWTKEMTYRFVNSILDEAVDDDPVLYFTTVTLVTALIIAQPCDASLGVFVKACQKLRCDAVAESREYHIGAAFKLASVLAHHPSLIAHLPSVETIAELIASAPNTLDKTQPTKALCTAITTYLASRPPDTSHPLVVFADIDKLRRVMRIVYSWQQSAAEFQDGTHEALHHMIHALAGDQRTSGVLLHIFRNLPPSFSTQIATTYGINFSLQ